MICKWEWRFIILVAVLIVQIAHSKHCVPADLKLSEFRKAQWLLDTDGTFVLSFPHCTLRHFTAHAAKECLEGKHLVFMGDSLTRYFYLSLAHLIATEHWSPKIAHVTNPKYPRNIIWEKDFPTWAAYYERSNAILNHQSKGDRTYELCDCFRDDAIPWSPEDGCTADFCSQEESMIENRNMRVYRDVATGTGASTRTSRDTGTGAVTEFSEPPDPEPLLRLSYMQFFGPQPTRGRKVFSTKLPKRERAYRAYIDRLGQLGCPKTKTGAASGASHGLVPITGKCGLSLRDLRDGDDFKHNFPQYYDDVTGLFDQEVLGPMGATHVMANIGWHSSLLGVGDNETETDRWLSARGEGARKQFAPPSGTRPLLLPQFTWRGTTAFGPFGEGNDKAVLDFNGRQSYEDRLGFHDLWSVTAHLWEVHEWIVKSNGTVNMAAFLGDLGGDSAPDTKLDENWRELALLDLKLTPRFKGRASSLFKHHHSNRLILPPIFVDHAHPQPWVYNELNNALLNAICPV